jgi:hypothetical protein
MGLHLCIRIIHRHVPATVIFWLKTSPADSLGRGTGSSSGPPSICWHDHAPPSCNQTLACTGHGNFTYADGNTYVGEFRDGFRHRVGTLTSANGTVIREGLWLNGEPVKGE